MATSESPVTDLSTFEAMLTRAGVVFDKQTDLKGRSSICIEQERDSKKNVGYDGFFTEFSFEPNGSLLSVGVWE